MSSPNQPSVFGRSLQLANGDLVFSGDDFAPVVGRDNFLQALQVMIETPFGTDIFNVNYGFDLLSAISLPQALGQIKDLIRLSIVKSLSLDDRVREITEVVFSDEPRFLELNPQSDAADDLRARKSQRRWQAIVVFQTAAEGQVALQVQGPGL